MRMKIFILLMAFLLMPSTVFALACQDIEYAELKDMSQKTSYCEIQKNSKANYDRATKYDTNSAWDDLTTCLNLIKKMDRIYKERFKKEIPKCKG